MKILKDKVLFSFTFEYQNGQKCLFFLLFYICGSKQKQVERFEARIQVGLEKQIFKHPKCGLGFHLLLRIISFAHSEGFTLKFESRFTQKEGT